MAATKLWLAQQLMNGRGTGSITPSTVGSVSGGMSGSLSMRYGTATSDSYNGWVQVKMDMADSSISCISDTPIKNGQRVAVLTTSSGQLKAIPIGNNITDMVDRSVSSVDTEFALGDSATVAPTSGWQTTPPSDDEGGYVWQRVKTTFMDGSTEYSNPARLSSSSELKGIASTKTEYAVNNSGVDEPESGWSASVPSVGPGQFLWSRLTTTYTDGTTSVMYSVSYMGEDGQPGGQGVGIKSSTVTYCVSTSGTDVPDIGWSTTVPTVPEGKYLWTRTVFSYTNGDSTTTYSVSKAGENGAPGLDGNGVLSVTISYASGTSGTTPPSSGWQSSVPSTSKGQYLWTRAVTAYTNSPSTTMYSVAYLGEDGQPGGQGVGIKSTTIQYKTSTSGTTPPSGTWSSSVPSVTPGQYLWTRVQMTYTNGDSYTTYSVSKQGVGIETIQEQYALHTSSTTAPPQNSSAWSDTCPEWEKDHYIWQRSRITWEDGTVTYTTAILSSALNQANEKAEVSTWYTFADEEGTHVVSTPNDATKGPNVLLNGYNLIFRDGTDELASFSPEEFEMLGFFIKAMNDGQSISIGGNNLVIGSKPPTTSGWDMESVGVNELVQRCAAMYAEVFGDITSTATNTWAEGVFYTGNDNIVTFNTGTVMNVDSSRRIHIQQTGVYKVSLYGAVYSCSEGDLCHFGLGTDADNILVDAQQNMNGNWGTIAKTALMRVTEPDILLKPFYKCEQGYGSKLATNTSSVTIEYLGVG